MSRFRRLAFLLVLPVVVLTSVFYPAPQEVDAAPVSCTGPEVMFGRQRWCGYFRNSGYSMGEDVRIGGVPSSVNRVNEFINMIEGDLNSSNAQRRTGAQFIILTMLGRGPGSPKSVTNSQLNDWKERVRSYGNISESGNTSRGENGRIDWKVWQRPACTFRYNGQNYSQNTYYQGGGRDDVAAFLDANCGSSAPTEEFMLFRDNSGNVIYRFRRACMNPMGTLQSLSEPRANEYNLRPSISATVDGQAVTGGVEVGQTVRFNYSVRNSGRDPSPDANCTIYSNVHNGYATARSNPSPGGGAGPPTGCPRIFGANSTVQLGGPEDVLITDHNQTICRSLFVSPATDSVSSRGVEACVSVVAKPYLKVYGGDIMAGASKEAAPGVCVGEPDAAIISWNKGSGSSYAGAGTQFAAMAMREIFEVATSLGGSSGAAPAPSGLAFANTATSDNVYGGLFGDLPCIKDYLADKPDSTLPFVSLDQAETGVYELGGAGQLELSGSVRPGARVTIFADGDVFINGNIIYPESWTAGEEPLLQLITSGNIYIGNSVSRIDGVFISQSDGGSGGAIHTCAISASPLDPRSDNFYSLCNNKLTINGAFVANEVRFLRTNGTRHQAAPGESSGSGSIAEEFNFGPALWMSQPAFPGGALRYDSITGLPPIL